MNVDFLYQVENIFGCKFFK